MNSINYNTNDGNQRIRIALKDRKSELKRIGLERLLSAVFKRNLLITQLLEEIGVEKHVIDSLKLRNLQSVVESTICYIQERVCSVENGSRRYAIIERYYGLDGNMPAKLSAMAAKYTISRERIRQIKERCLASLRLKIAIDGIEEHLKLVAHRYCQTVLECGPTKVSGAQLEAVAPRLLSHRDLTMISNLTSYLTEAQMVAFSNLVRGGRVKVSGVSGSGKTMLAVLTAQALAARGKKVLVTCYNRALATYLESLLSHQPNITVASYHALCLRLGTRANLKIPGGWNSSVWDHKFPEVLEEAVRVSPDLKFDSVIVDDAQDFKRKWWHSLETILKDSVKGDLFCFLDHNRLLVCDRGFNPEMRQELDLRENLRSPQTLVPFLSGGYAPRYAHGSGATFQVASRQGELPEFYLCPTREDMRLTISHLIEEMTTIRGFEPSQIAVLTPRLTKNSKAYGCTIKGCGRLVVRYSQLSSHVMLSRISTFKGLERRAIIVADLDEEFAQLDQEERLKLLYLAASRSSQRLVFLGDVRGWKELNTIQEQLVSTTYGATNLLAR